MPKKEYRNLIRNNGERDKQYVYLDPVPAEMRSLIIMELCTVPIDWKMLTTLRPKTKLEEDYYSKYVVGSSREFFSEFSYFLIFRLIELGKLQIKTEHRDKREYMLNPAVRKVKNKSGIIETRIQTCPECSEEYCNGRTCCDFNYDLYGRIQLKSSQPNKGAPVVGTSITKDNATDKKGGQKKKIRSHKFKNKKRSRSVSPVKRSVSTSKK